MLKEIETWGGCVEALHEYISNMPSAYDVDAMVKELNAYKLGECMNNCEHYDNCSNYIYSKGYNKAIDDVMAKAREIQEEQIKNLEQYPKRYGKQWAVYMNTHLGHIQVACRRLIAEQLKEGSADNE